MIFPFVTVILTWTGPYLVSAASPVTVFVPVELPDPELPELPELFGLVEVPEPLDPLEVDGSVVVADPDPAAVAEVTECVLKPSSTTSEATVLTIASRTRRIVSSFEEQSDGRDQNSKDSECTWRRGTPADIRAVRSPEVISGGPHR